MQFHLNGFRPGDPDILAAADGVSRADALPETVDVLIVGCGPAGLTLAAQLAASPRSDGDRRSEAGAAHARTSGRRRLPHDGNVQAFGFASASLREAYWVNESDVLEAGRFQPRRNHAQRTHTGRRGRAVGIPACNLEPGARARFLSRRHAQFARPNGALLFAPPRRSPSLRRRGSSRNGDLRARGGRRRDRDGAGALRGRMRRRAQPDARGAGLCAEGRGRQSGLGRDGRAGGH